MNNIDKVKAQRVNIVEHIAFRNDLKKLTLEIINEGKSDLIQKKNQNLTP